MLLNKRTPSPYSSKPYGSSVFGAITRMSLHPSVCNAATSERATRECLISPMMAIEISSNFFLVSRRMVSMSNIACVGCA